MLCRPRTKPWQRCGLQRCKAADIVQNVQLDFVLAVGCENCHVVGGTRCLV